MQRGGLNAALLHWKLPYTVGKRLLAKKPRKEEEQYSYVPYKNRGSSSFLGFLARSRFPTVYGNFQNEGQVDRIDFADLTG